MTMHPLLERFCNNYFVRFYEIYPTWDEAARLGLGALTKEEKKKFKFVLDDVISQNHTADDLVKLWNNSGADVRFGDGEEVRTLFRHARQMIR